MRICANCGVIMGPAYRGSRCGQCRAEIEEYERAGLSTVDEAAHDFWLQDAAYRRSDALERQARIEEALA